MCGINGILGNMPINRLQDRIDEMNHSIRHRGPDSLGSFIINKSVAFGHARLKIIDLSKKADQPMLSIDRRYSLVFNGEIYNFKEIKNELNYNFISTSDTEVVLASIVLKGVDWFLGKANGMFAIAFYDSKTDTLLLIRDRLGIKPLYYTKIKQNFIFSSEIKAILKSGLVEAVFNDELIDEYLANRFIIEPNTFFRSIYQVKAGHYLKIQSGNVIDDKQYWVLPNPIEETNKNENEIINEFEFQLVKAIRYRLISDVPLGTYLSGGVDSSLLTAITSLNKLKPINTYTIGFNENGFNEFAYSDLVAKQYNTQHHKLILSINDYVNEWESLIKYKDAPLGVPNEIPLAVMSRELKKKITVVLSGEGADELLGGYGKIFRAYFEYENKYDSSNDFVSYFIQKYEYVPSLIRNIFLRTKNNREERYQQYKEMFVKSGCNQNSIFQFFHKIHIKGLLQRLDTTTMQASVEGRVPFLDHNLIEWVYNNVPYDLKLKWKTEQAEQEARYMAAEYFSERNDIPKYLLRKLSYKYLPREIIERDKIGFPVPLNNWYQELTEKAVQILSNAEWFDHSKIDNLLLIVKKDKRFGQILWMFINIEIFRRNYFEKKWSW